MVQIEEDQIKINNNKKNALSDFYRKQDTRLSWGFYVNHAQGLFMNYVTLAENKGGGRGKSTRVI